MHNTSAVPNICCCLPDSLWWSSFMFCQRSFLKIGFRSIICVSILTNTQHHISGEKNVSLLFIYASDQSLLCSPSSHPGGSYREELKGPSVFPAKLWSLAVSRTTFGVVWCCHQDYFDFLAHQPLRDTCSCSLRQKYLLLKFTFPL